MTIRNRSVHAAAWTLVLYLLFGRAAPTRAGSFETDAQLWSNVTAVGSFRFLSPKLGRLRYWLEGQGRFGNDMSDFSQGFVRPGLGWALSDRASAWVGYAYVATDAPFAAPGRSFYENRVWEQFQWAQPTAIGAFTARTRLEQRFATSGSVTGVRARQLFKLSWPIPAFPELRLVGADEVFVNLNSTDWGPQAGLDQNRFFAGLGYALGENVTTEIGYLNLFIARDERIDRMDNILAINFLLAF